MRNGIGSYKTKHGTRYWFKVKVGNHIVVKGGFLRSEDARIARADVVSEYRGNSLKECPYFNLLCDTWLKRHCKEVKVSTGYQLRGLVKNYIKDRIPNKRIDLLNYLDFSDWWDWVCEKPIKKKNYLLHILWEMMDFANVEYFYFGKEYKRLIPFKDYSIKDPFVDKTKRQVLSIEEMGRFMKAVGDRKFKLMFLLAFMTGMRISEVRGLVRKAIVGNHLYVYQQVSRIGKKALVNSGLISKKEVSKAGNVSLLVPPKSLSSNRVYSLPKTLAEALSSWCSDYSLKDNDFVFFSQFGDYSKPVGERTVSRKLDDAIEKSGVPRITFHKFRHLDATFLHDMGLDDTSIALYLGHKNPEVTRDYYLHQSDQKEKTISDDMEKVSKRFI